MGFRAPWVSSFGLFLIIIFLFSANGVVEASSRRLLHRHHHGRGLHAAGFRPAKLFVFGDSYADTGNNKMNEASWKVPYGVTFPGKPAGRFSSGRVLTDFLAKSVGLESPVPYQGRNMEDRRFNSGMNFAYGGTGVFDTTVAYPNMTTQIGLFKQLIDDGTFSAADLASSLTLVTLSGNDYSAYTAKNGLIPSALQEFIVSVVSQLGTNLKQLYELGARKVAVAALQPLGCIPRFTAVNSFQKCNDTLNSLVGFHNQLLRKAVSDLNNQTASSTFVVVDLYTSFMSVLNSTDSTFVDPLKPCCVGVSSRFNCGTVDADGTKKYTVCEAPESAFFWDMAHPTQAGWRAVYTSLSAALEQQL
ncbi:hypothetical protein SAY86_018363 [Trapa natans]|uniref:GDSL esterase/lipase n=1 Tax=Trapa natans TaxID=22666 RepID=A0AAN7R0W3_TRANT|nr:hypothetical protein SAY86_018363 [Trapa natans]